MRAVGMILAAMALALAGTSALAECPTAVQGPCQTITEPCPTVTQTTCPSVAQQPCVQPYVCPPPMSLPACVGAGPAPAVVGLCGPDFDRGYITRMYQLHGTVAALAEQGAQQASDADLRRLSAKIHQERIDQNNVYAKLAGDFGCAVSVDCSPAQAVLATFTHYCGTDFDVQYARAMIALLAQERDAAQIAVTQSTVPRVRDQAAIEARAAQNEINALERWLSTRCPQPCPTSVCPPAVTTTTCPSVCPAPAVPACPGAGPAPCPVQVAPVCPGAGPAPCPAPCP